MRVAVFCKGEKQAEAKEAGADAVGAEELVAKVKEGWLEFDAAVATPDVMALVGQIGRLLGPRGLMPNAKTGSVTFDVTKAVTELKAGRVEFKVDKAVCCTPPWARFLSVLKDPGQPQSLAGHRQSPETLGRQGLLHVVHGGFHHHGARFQGRYAPGQKIS